MTSVAKAQTLIRGIGEILAPEMPAKVRYDKIFNKLIDLLPDLTKRRVRALHNGEAHRVDHEEVIALEELRAIEEARSEHRQFVAYTNKLAALHAVGATSLSREELEVLARIARRPAVIPGAANANSRRADRGMAGARAA